jgi:ribosomal-protein-alanine N-acetyltransferase
MQGIDERDCGAGGGRGVVVRLETERLWLMPWEAGDVDAFRPIARDPEVVRYIRDGQPWAEDQVVEFVERQVRHYAGRGYCMWKLVEKASGEVAGFCGVQPLRGTDEIEIGWWLVKRCWGKGLATEAARVVMEDAVGRIGLKRIVAVAHVENGRSHRVMEKLGMRFEKNWEYMGTPVVFYSREV